MKLFKKVTWKNTIIHIVLSFILAVLIVTMCFGKLKLNANATMDSLTFYKADLFFQNINIQGDIGRKSYLILHLIDYAFITQFYLSFTYILLLLINKIQIKNWLRKLYLLPLFAASMDLLENLTIDFSILIYPKEIIFLGNISGYFTLLKFTFIYIFFLLVILFTLISLFKKIKNRWSK